MNGRRILAVFFLLPALAAGYMTWLMGRTGDSSKWLFAVFTLFLLLMTIAPFLPKAKTMPKTETGSASTRFVPHWFMLLAMFAIGLAIIAIVGSILRH